jgi:hypothetical protein
MTNEEQSVVALRLGFWAALLLVVALPLSGPLGMVIVAALAPQPPWRDPVTFMAHYHPIQGLPFMFGFLLLLGFAALAVALYFRARPAQRPLALLGVLFTAVFCALIAGNYIAQTALVPAAVKRGDAATVAMLSMASPSAICWSVEMFGYGFLGLASLCVAPSFPGRGLARATSALLLANAGVSVVGAVLTAYDSGWVLTTGGLVAFGGWNVVILAMCLAIALTLHRELRGDLPPAPAAAPAGSSPRR